MKMQKVLIAALLVMALLSNIAWAYYVSALTSKNEMCISEKNALANRNETLTEEVADLQAQLARSEREYAQCQRELQIQSLESYSYKSWENGVLRESFSSKDEHIEALQEKVKELKEQLRRCCR